MQNQNNIVWPGWETVRLIGRGSFGAVYEIQRAVFGDVEKAAVKVISVPQAASDIDELYNDGYDEASVTTILREHLKSIVAEYSLTRKMNGCSNIVSCDDIRYIAREDGIGWDIFIKMELLTPLAKALPNEVPEATVVRIAKDLCVALDLCRKHGIVHRDIKPQNIFISPNGDYKLGDFGIAKTVEKTMGGTRIGTYKYMAPEVYNNQPYGGSADIYSLGLVLYWLLNERRMPFVPLPPALVRSGDEEMARLLRFSGEPLPAPKNGSERLQAIVLKACAYDPKERYASAAAMRAELKALEEAIPLVSVLPDFSDPAEYEPEERTVGLFGKKEESARPDPGREDATVRILEQEEVDEPTVSVRTVPREKPAAAEKKPAAQAEQPKPKKNRLMIAVGAAAAVLAVLLAIFFGGGQNREDVLQDQGGGAAETESLAETTAPEGTAPEAVQTVVPTELAPIIAVDAGWTHVAALREDGTVSVVIENGQDQGQGDTSGWTDIVSVRAGRSHTVGLKSDGTVVAAGADSCGQCGVSDWRDIAAIAAGDYFTAGLRKDGTVIAVGDIQWDTEGPKDIVFIDASDDLLCCYDKNGVVTILGKQDGPRELGEEPDCVSVSVSLNRSAALTVYGTARLLVCGSGEEILYDISGWSDLTQVDAGLNHIVGLRVDGRAEVVGMNEYGECDVTEWTDIVEICAAQGYTVGVKADGTLVSTGKYTGTGDNCDVSGLNRNTKRIPKEEQHVFPEITDSEDEMESVTVQASWSAWVTKLPEGVDSTKYEIQEKTQYSYYIISEQNWAKKGSWMCTECAITPGADRYVVDSVEETWESCWRDGNGNYLCDCVAHLDLEILLPTQPVGGATSYYEEKLSESATQYRYCDKINGSTYGEWSAWQFESVSASESRQVETRTVFHYGVKVTATTHYHCHPVWSAYGDTPVKEDSDTAVRTRTVYRYRERT